MAIVAVRKSQGLKGEVKAPSSKAFTHRTLIAALLSDGVSRIFNPLDSEDTTATRTAITALGASVTEESDCLNVKGSPSLTYSGEVIQCGESGATLRFLLPIAALTRRSVTFQAGPSLRKRPIAPLIEGLKMLGCMCNIRPSAGTLEVDGKGLRGGMVKIRGDISSQYISGLLFASPLASSDVEISVTTPLESRSYVHATIQVINRHGVIVTHSPDMRLFEVPSGQRYQPRDMVIPGDFSSASFLLAASTLSGGDFTVVGLDEDSAQADREILNILGRMGVKVEFGEGKARAKGGDIKPLRIDATDIPDMVPVIVSLACYAEGRTFIFNAKRLRYKESDRLASLYSEFKKLGADITLTEDSLSINGSKRLEGTRVDSKNDHRIAMALAVAALAAEGETTISGAECVSKSYPHFFEDLKSLGANVEWLEAR